ncbi:MAG: DnaJ domain-containing protein, partial [Gammaproteobacteria bacterium]|nr:DnaJ domain-containing protein [Gammaproteobacteria bacterium]
LQVLEAYLDRMHSDWREAAQYEDEPAGTSEEPAMNHQLALEILGLSEDADKDEVVKAHRKLMQRMHPDRGGTEYLAKKINAARDYLVEHL